jgi:circadian clock protein KaiC
MHKMVAATKPRIVVVDPISNLIAAGNVHEVAALLTRLLDFLKVEDITALFASLNTAGHSLEATEFGISSIMDTWLLLRDIEIGGERNRGIYVLKSRGMAHSNQIREFILTDHGIKLVDVYLGPEGVLTGSARAAQEGRERAETLRLETERGRKQLAALRKRKMLEAQLAVLQAEIDSGEQELEFALNESVSADERQAEMRKNFARLRKAGSAKS